MSDLESADFFTDQSLIGDPYPYFNQLRSKCPVAPEAHHGLLAVTGMRVGWDLRHAWIHGVTSQIHQIQHSYTAIPKPHVNRCFRQQELHERLALGRQFRRGFNHHELRAASSHLKFHKGNEQITSRSRLQQNPLIAANVAVSWLTPEGKNRTCA